MRRVRSILLSVGAMSALILGTLVGLTGPATAASSLPCDIYGGAGTPCVAAHSTVRALIGSYNGPLYQLTRSSDNATHNVGLLSTGGYVNVADHDAFCDGTTCTITVIYDQTTRHNDLTVSPAGTAGAADFAADASVLAITAGGHKAYGLWISPQHGYRKALADGTARAGQPEGMYMVASGTRVGSDCCFDYGNAEAEPADTGNGHMDAVTIATTCFFGSCTGSGPWVQADLENGLFLGANGYNPANLGNNSTYVTALLKNNGQTTYAVKGGNSQSGGLTTWWDGALPDLGGYRPMQQEGSIILGTGGDNSNRNIGTFFEGVMTAGYPSDAADNAVQANIVSVGYSGRTDLPTAAQATISGPGGKCVDVIGDDTGRNLAAVGLYDCIGSALDQHWTHFADNSLRTLGRCLDIAGGGTGNQTQLQLYDCTGAPGQRWVQQADGSLLNPPSGRCVDSPNGNTANGTRLQIYDCNGTGAQKFAVNGGGTAIGPGGKCVDVDGDDNGGPGTAVQLWACQSYAVDQHWVHAGDGSLRTLGRCLDIVGDGTALSTQVQLWDCSGIGGQVWRQQANGSLVNPQSGRCLDSPGGSTSNGSRLQIYDCNGTPAQKFALS